MVWYISNVAIGAEFAGWWEGGRMSLASGSEYPVVADPLETNSVETFLSETEYCDHRSSAIQACVARAIGPLETPRERAVALFYLVRDRIIWELGHWNRTASETLAAGRGSCSNKANLLVALLRAAGIPAGFRMMSVTPDYLGAIIPSEFWNIRADPTKPSRHFYTTLLLDDRWIRVDATDDIGVSRCAAYVPESRLVDFDGSADAILNLEPAHILTDDGPLPSIDDYLRRPPGNAAGLSLAFARACETFVRREGSRFGTSAEMHEALYRWLARHHPVKYLAFRALLHWRTCTRRLRTHYASAAEEMV
jgi:Transglutaminase-like superfamily